MTDIIEITRDFLVGAPIYKISVLTRTKEITDLKAYRGKVLLIVNSATGCGFTPQYEALEEMYKAYKDKGFEILDFPSNQFGQAEGSDNDIHSFCTARYDISFPQFAKIEVNGENQSELYAFLKKRQGFKGFLLNSKESVYLQKITAKADPGYLNNPDIKWNFTKFLVNRRGMVVDRFEPDAGTDIVRQGIEKILNDD
ncbi:MAG: glutathione peroxidase [Lachnospiraceae bacterium]|nr:glutathione peroxidase [Lachnospiraceae bacterium]